MKETTPSNGNNCNFSGIRPAMADLSWPSVRVCGRNPSYANLLGIDHSGMVSEMTAITQYISNENRLSSELCPLARSILGIAMAEMIHLQKLGELICLLGGNVDFTARYRGSKPRMWTPAYLSHRPGAREMLLADIESEKQAIAQYTAHIKIIDDAHVNAVLKRIIVDEKYHIMLLQGLLAEM